MDTLIGTFIAVAVVGVLLLLDLLAIRFGVDSRDQIGDHWARPMSPKASSIPGAHEPQGD